MDNIVDNKFTAILVTLASLAIFLVLGQVSGGDGITGQFYVGDNTTSPEERYNSIDWNKSTTEGQPAGAIHNDSFKKLNSTEIEMNNKTQNISSDEALTIQAQTNNTLNISFSKEIIGVEGRNLTIYNNSYIKFRFLENISLNIEEGNRTLRKKIDVYIPESESNVSSDNQTDVNKTEEAMPKLTLSENTSANITSDQVELVNTENYTKTLKAPENSSLNISSAEIASNSSLIFNKSKEKTLNLSAINKTSYIVERLKSGNKTKSLGDTGNKTEPTESNSTEENKTTVKNEREENNTTKNVNQNISEENTTENVSNSVIPEKGGEWMKIQSKGIDEFYIFKYEASRKDANSTNEGDSRIPYSQHGVEPWNGISQEDASDACDSLGENYSLPSNKQWQAATGAVPGKSETFVNGNTQDGSSHQNQDQVCEISEKAAWNEKYCLTGTGPNDWQTTTGVTDMKGNLWEWVSNTVEISSSKFPAGEKGWISSWNRGKDKPEGIKDKRGSSGVQNSYYYSASEGEFAIRRGGAWYSGERAGLFSMNIDRKKTDSRSSIGFRCVYEN